MGYSGIRFLRRLSGELGGWKTGKLLTSDELSRNGEESPRESQKLGGLSAERESGNE